MKITTLMENTACDAGLAFGHGLSLYIETPRHKILFDTGPDEGFLSNAERLGVDLTQVDLAILSHGHYDHGGGLRSFLTRNTHAKVYLRKGAFGNYLSRADGDLHYIGLDQTLREFEDRFVFTAESLRLDEELLLFSDVPDTCGALRSSAKLLEQTGETLIQDPFRHEQDLLITAEGKTILVAGCAHRGILNILRTARKAAGGEIDATFGGFHLFQLEEGDPEADKLIDQIGGELRKGTTVYYTGHCTGDYACQRLKTILGDRLQAISGGKTVDFPPTCMAGERSQPCFFANLS